MKIRTEEFYHILEINHHNIYLGSGKIGLKLELIKQYSIMTIITISNNYYQQPQYPSGIKTHLHLISEMEAVHFTALFPKVLAQIKEALLRGNVLLVGVSGLSLTPAIIITFLIKYYNWSLDRCFLHMKIKLKIPQNVIPPWQKLPYNEKQLRKKENVNPKQHIVSTDNDINFLDFSFACQNTNFKEISNQPCEEILPTFKYLQIKQQKRAKPRYLNPCLSVNLTDQALVPPEAFQRYNRISEERGKDLRRSDSFVTSRKKSSSAVILYKLQSYL